jgi:hypothetical protein
MKNTLLTLALLVATTSSAYAFTDYGVNEDGAQCFDESCDIVYSNDRSLIGDARSLDLNATVFIAQPNAPTQEEMLARQAEVRRQICLIIGCK